MTHGTVHEVTDIEGFTSFVKRYRPMLQKALVAVVGPDLAGDACAEAFAYCWSRWDQIREMESPGGYVWSVGRSKGRDLMRRDRKDLRVLLPEVPSSEMPLVEPALPMAISRLSERQRVVVFLIHGSGWTYSEVAEFLGVSVSTVQRHAERGLAKLQRELGVQR